MENISFVISFKFSINQPRVLIDKLYQEDDDRLFILLDKLQVIPNYQHLANVLTIEWISSNFGPDYTINFLVEYKFDSLEIYLYENLEEFKDSYLKLVLEIREPFSVILNDYQIIKLDSKIMNCGHCQNCGCWVTNRELNNPKPIKALSIGALYLGKLLCDECLPDNHPLVF